MAPFTDDESSWSRLDYVLLRDGGVALYWADHVLREDLAWLRGQGYAICELDAGDWKAEEDFHDAVAKALEFPGYYPAVGAVPVLWNPREWTNAKRGL
jgi:hypothetical protein